MRAKHKNRRVSSCNTKKENNMKRHTQVEELVKMGLQRDKVSELRNRALKKLHEMASDEHRRFGVIPRTMQIMGSGSASCIEFNLTGMYPDQLDRLSRP